MYRHINYIYIYIYHACTRAVGPASKARMQILYALHTRMPALQIPCGAWQLACPLEDVLFAACVGFRLCRFRV